MLKGGIQTIQKLPAHPVCRERPQFDIARTDRVSVFAGLQLYWHLPPLYDPHNFYRNPVNEFGRTVSINMLGIHSSVTTDISGLKPIESPTSDWRQR